MCFDPFPFNSQTLCIEILKKLVNLVSSDSSVAALAIIQARDSYIPTRVPMDVTNRVCVRREMDSLGDCRSIHQCGETTEGADNGAKQARQLRAYQKLHRDIGGHRRQRSTQWVTGNIGMCRSHWRHRKAQKSLET